MIVLCIDVGSSSVKYAFYRGTGPLDCTRLDAGEMPGSATDPASLVERLWQTMGAHKPGAIGHRIVLGGSHFFEPVPVNDGVLRDVEALVSLEPLHLRAEIDVVRAVAARAPGVPQVLCFDTAFHQRMPAVARQLPLPAAIDPGLRRFGFHGLSYEYVASQLGERGAGRTIVAHLGSGASLCAMRAGELVDTTMGFSVLGGLMMATRPGDLDPGVLLQLMSLGYDSAEKLSDLLYHRCGLSGVSGGSGDMRALRAASPGDVGARAAVDLFDYQLLKHTGSMIAVLGGLDTLVFTGGIGEHDAATRATLCRSLEYMELRLDDDANARNATTISTLDSAIEVLVIATDENLMIARHTLETLKR